jgi:hypothetical protein
VGSKVSSSGVVVSRYYREGPVTTSDYAMDPPTPAEVARRERMNRER